MGVFKVNGTDITTIGEVVNTGDTRTKSNFFNSGKVSVTGLSDSSKTMAYAKTSESNWGMYNIVGDKLKVNGTADRVAKKGTRPHLVYGQWPDEQGLAENENTGSNKSLTLTYNSSTGLITCSHVDGFTNGLTGGCLANGGTIAASVIVVCLCGGGGGGGGSGVGAGGGGGGGAATLICLLDFNNMPSKKCTITLGHPGSPGSSTGTTGYGGNGGTASYITAGNGTVLAYAHGGGGGQKGKDGGGGGGGSVENKVGTTNYFRNYSGSAGANGGTRGAGGNSTANAASTPDGSYTPRQQKGGVKGGGNNGGSGGGAGGSSVWTATGTGWGDLAYNGGGDGGYDANNASLIGLFGGGGGGAGGTAILTGRAGTRGGNGCCYIYY